MDPIVLDKPEQIRDVRKFVIWQCVKTDLLFNGKMKLARNYRISDVKKEFGLKGNKQSVFEQLTQILLKDGTLRACANHPDKPTKNPSVGLCGDCARQGIKVVKTCPCGARAEKDRYCLTCFPADGSGNKG